MNKKKACIYISVLTVILIIAAAITVTLVLVLKNDKKHGPVLDNIISDNSTFPNGSYKISVDSLKPGLSKQAPLLVNTSIVNDLGVRIDNSSLVAETNRLSYFFVRLPADNTTDKRVKRQLESNTKSIGIRFGNSDTINVIPLNLSKTINSGLRVLGMLEDNSQVYQLEVRMADAMCSNKIAGSCTIVNWTPYSISSENTGSKAEFSNTLPVACGSQCDADTNSLCATSCSPCDGQQVAGADTPVTRRYKMGTTAAKNLKFSFETYIVKDRITVSHEGNHLFDSGCVGTDGEKNALINFKGTSREVRVDVEPNCEGTSGTAWYFTLPCPDCKGCEEYQHLDDSKAHCGPNGYLINYGLYFCNRYYEHYTSFTKDGQEFIDCVRCHLLHYLEDYLNKVSGEVNCAELLSNAFDSHIEAYTSCGFCNVYFGNIGAFWNVLFSTRILFTPSLTKQIIAITKKCPRVYVSKLCVKYPLICKPSLLCEKYPILCKPSLLCEKYPILCKPSLLCEKYPILCRLPVGTN